MSLGTYFYTWFFGNFVGNDENYNKYYCNSKNFEDREAKRWVVFNGVKEATKVPPHWHAWLHKTIDTPPVKYSHVYNWQKEHHPNLSGTSDAYYPSSHPLSKSKNNIDKTEEEYEKWRP